MIIVHGVLKVSPEYRAAFLEAAGRAVEESKAEDGNLEYRLFEAVDEPNTFLTLEKWRDAEAVENHKNNPHFIHYIKASHEFLTAPIEIDIHTLEDK
ncbi:putative quinol monooxygenase [Bacillus sp. FJAT-49736]|uniref:putative quinol monooxygenase n=1 Tax=Bacillus sp. FJAT-49736 TaxID=2833582 RepID=UPI001BC8F8DB|nr:putative quinol monooxygenase [Bacillus sp. FJAT-49736]MBS4175123.1 antibiotic biosynthesis monooxygenase [Bacillus sp. FJAT-49736]